MILSDDQILADFRSGKDKAEMLICLTDQNCMEHHRFAEYLICIGVPPEEIPPAYRPIADANGEEDYLPIKAFADELCAGSYNAAISWLRRYAPNLLSKQNVPHRKRPITVVHKDAFELRRLWALGEDTQTAAAADGDSDDDDDSCGLLEERAAQEPEPEPEPVRKPAPAFRAGPEENAILKAIRRQLKEEQDRNELLKNTIVGMACVLFNDELY